MFRLKIIMNNDLPLFLSSRDPVLRFRSSRNISVKVLYNNISTTPISLESFESLILSHDLTYLQKIFFKYKYLLQYLLHTLEVLRSRKILTPVRYHT